MLDTRKMFTANEPTATNPSAHPNRIYHWTRTRIIYVYIIHRVVMLPHIIIIMRVNNNVCRSYGFSFRVGNPNFRRVQFNISTWRVVTFYVTRYCVSECVVYTILYVVLNFAFRASVKCIAKHSYHVVRCSHCSYYSALVIIIAAHCYLSEFVRGFLT